MRPSILLGIAVAVVALAAAACGSTGGKQTTPSSTAPQSTAPTSVSAPTSAPNGTTSTTASGVNPSTPEINPSGDIPDNQVFVKYASRDGKYALVVPEGWARTETGGATSFADHFNSIRIEATKSAAAPTVATSRATEVPVLQRDVSGFALGNVTSVGRTAGVVVLVTYRANSAADAVTGKRAALDVERYEFWRNGTQVTITLSAPQGSDNVDPWKKVTESFAWAT
jgi:hypothetical protein